MHVAAIVFIPFLGAVLTPFLYPKLRKYVGWWAAGLSAAVFILVLSLVPSVSDGEIREFSLNWVPSFDINLSLYVDGLSLLFALIVSGIGTLIFVYANSYLSSKENLGRFYAFMLFFMGSMLGTVLASNLIILFVFWELMSLSCFLLIGYWHESEEARHSAIKALLVTGIGGLAMLGGFVLLYVITGTWEIREILERADQITSSSLSIPAMVLILAGAFSKSAQFPFYFWLPRAMVAPTPVSAFLHAATMVKAGIFLIARFYPIWSETDAWFYIITSVGLLTMLIGAYMAVRKHELKAILAYSTVSQLGLIVALLGYSVELGVVAALFHVVSHALFKGALFLIAGAVDHSTGTRLVRRLSGLAVAMPWTAVFCGITALAMAGVPPLNGFLSKEMFYEASLEGGLLWIIPVVAVTGAIMTFMYSLRLFHGVFFGEQSLEATHAHESPKVMLIPIGLLAGLCVLIGIFPGLIQERILEPAVSVVVGEGYHLHDIGLWHGLNMPLLMSIITIAVGFVAYIGLRNALRSQAEYAPKHGMNYVYDNVVLKFLIDGTHWIFDRLQSGYLRHYLLMMVILITGLVGYSIAAKADLSLPGFSLGGLEPYEYALAGLIIIAAIGTVLAKERISAIITVGAVGILVVVFWLVYSAPDLALTQLLIEIVTVVLFVMVFFHALPFAKGKISKGSVGRDALVAICFGGMITILMLTVLYGGFFDDTLRNYYFEHAQHEAGARNIVNVIIVDFRGYDTMGEITVLAIAAIALFCLHKLRKGEKQK